MATLRAAILAPRQDGHVLLAEGHLWGQKEVAIPIRAVTGVEDGIRVNLTKDEIAALPPVATEH